MNEWMNEWMTDIKHIKQRQVLVGFFWQHSIRRITRYKRCQLLPLPPSSSVGFGHESNIVKNRYRIVRLSPKTRLSAHDTNEYISVVTTWPNTPGVGTSSPPPSHLSSYCYCWILLLRSLIRLCRRWCNPWSIIIHNPWICAKIRESVPESVFCL